VVTASGEIDLSTAPLLRQRLLEVVADHVTHLVVDLSRVPFIDSTGLGVLVGAHRRLAADQGRMSVIATERTLDTIRRAGVDQLMRTYATLPEALGQ
jgi:anti-sigma B factor antagonist